MHYTHTHTHARARTHIYNIYFIGFSKKSIMCTRIQTFGYDYEVHTEIRHKNELSI